MERNADSLFGNDLVEEELCIAEAITLRGCFRRLLSLRPCWDGGCGLTLETLETDAIFSNRQLYYEHDKGILSSIQKKKVILNNQSDSDTQE